MALQDNCTGYYKLQADGTDSVGTLGTATGTAPTYTTGFIENGGSFASASSQYLETATYVGGTSWSFSLWINPTSLATYNPITKDKVTGTERCWNLSMSASDITLYGWNASGTFYQTATTAHSMATGTWYNWIGVWDATATTMYLYKNGTLFTSVSITGNAEDTAVKLSIGRAGDATGYTNAKLDEIGIWSRALTTTEITAL